MANILKPKSTTLNPKALVYKRFNRIEDSANLLTIYGCLLTSSNTYKFFTFDKENQTFVEQTDFEAPQKTVQVTSDAQIFMSSGKYFWWNPINGIWSDSNTLPETYSTLSELGFANIGKYQTNRYVYAGTIDYMIKGSIEGSTTQFIKGNIMPLESLNIKYFDDFIQLSVDDLVVIENRLYSVENPDSIRKMQPRPYNIYYATLNSIL